MMRIQNNRRTRSVCVDRHLGQTSAEARRVSEEGAFNDARAQWDNEPACAGRIIARIG